MVDALLNAAHTEDAEYLDEEHYDVPQITTTAHVRTCEFCGSSNTPTWRRGPGGKGSLCNACGIKWRLRKRNKKTEQGAGPPEKKPKSSKASPTSSRKKRAREDHDEKEERKFVASPAVEDELNDEDYDGMDANRKNYYCKFCNKTWDITYFKNSQQFGAHCSNCSRKPRSDAAVPQSPSPVFYKDPSPAPTNLILILRYLQDELSDLEDEDTSVAAPSSPATPSTPSLPTVPQLPQFSQLPLPITTLPPLSSLALATPPLPTPSYDPLNTLRLAANECWHTAAVG